MAVKGNEQAKQSLAPITKPPSQNNQQLAPPPISNYDHWIPGEVPYQVEESAQYAQPPSVYQPLQAQAPDWSGSHNVHPPFSPPVPPHHHNPPCNRPQAYHNHYTQNRQWSMKKHKSGPQIQVIRQGQTNEGGSRVADSMQMMMMNSMMMQQMQAQQMQAAQMAALTQQTMQMQLGGQNLNQNPHLDQVQSHAKRDRKRKSGGSVNIRTVRQRPKGRKSRSPLEQGAPLPLPQVVNAPPPMVIEPPPGGTVELLAADNWQEATIILCFAAVGLIYLICSRGGGGEDDKKAGNDISKRHLS
ncbi:hypothetical protein IAR55_006072 [Kwoniella newhampshirensis]|uniref:Uncharacterized protein n=1 Tax=Kwoniella newhampshirensis TaxID=1651941 RepID=A0AAW0YFK1_9TREE